MPHTNNNRSSSSSSSSSMPSPLLSPKVRPLTPPCAPPFSKWEILLKFGGAVPGLFTTTILLPVRSSEIVTCLDRLFSFWPRPELLRSPPRQCPMAQQRRDLRSARLPRKEVSFGGGTDCGEDKVQESHLPRPFPVPRASCLAPLERISENPNPRIKRSWCAQR